MNALIDLTEIPEDVCERESFLIKRIDEMRQFVIPFFNAKLTSMLMIEEDEKEMRDIFSEISSMYEKFIPFSKIDNRPYLQPLFEGRGLVEQLGGKIDEYWALEGEDRIKVGEDIVRIAQDLGRNTGKRYVETINEYINELKKISGHE